MRYSSAEKLEIINLVIASDLGVKRSLECTLSEFSGQI